MDHKHGAYIYTVIQPKHVIIPDIEKSAKLT